MKHLVDSLEPRRLFSGGIDPTYGSSGAAKFTPPANAQVLDSTVDPGGRTILVGTVQIGTGDSATNQMFIARLNASGQLDPTFNGGLIQGTPRGITELDSVIALANGGYVGAQQKGFDPSLTSPIVRFTPSGHIDASFGHNGVRRVTVNVEEILERSDQSLIIVGDDIGRVNDDGGDGETEHYAMRINTRGSVDTTFGNDGYDLIGAANFADDFSGYGNTINSAALDKDDRLYLSGNAESGFTDPEDDDNGGEESVSVSRFHADGNPDDTFDASQQGSEQDYHQVLVDHQLDTTGTVQLIPRLGLIAVRPDGKTVVLSRDDLLESSDHSPGLTLLNATKNVDTSKVTVDFSKTAPSFAVPNVGYRNMRALPDNSLLIAGATISGSTQTPAIIKLKPDLSVDTSFGANGILTIGTAGKDECAGDLERAADGSIYAVSSAADERTGNVRTGDITVTRIFPDDNPIVTLANTSPFNGPFNLGERITVFIHGPHPIDTSSLDDNDLVLRGNGQIKKLRFVRSTQANDGSVKAIYRIFTNLLPNGDYSVGTVNGQILENQQAGDTSTILGNVTIA